MLLVLHCGVDEAVPYCMCSSGFDWELMKLFLTVCAALALTGRDQCFSTEQPFITLAIMATQHIVYVTFH